MELIKATDLYEKLVTMEVLNPKSKE
jgi:hypothetical protein